MGVSVGATIGLGLAAWFGLNECEAGLPAQPASACFRCLPGRDRRNTSNIAGNRSRRSRDRCSKRPAHKHHVANAFIIEVLAGQQSIYRALRAVAWRSVIDPDRADVARGEFAVQLAKRGVEVHLIAISAQQNHHIRHH